MAAPPKVRSTKRSKSKRRAKAAKETVVRRLPDSAIDPDKPVGIWRGLDRTDRDREDTTKVILTRDSIRIAVRRLARLAATWEATEEFAKATPEMRDYSLGYLEDVVSLLDRHARELPIKHVDGFCITPEDANLILMHHSVVAALQAYSDGVSEESTVHQLASALGNSYRVPRDAIENRWRRLSSSTKKNWVTERRSAVEAAKVFLASLIPGASEGRVARLRRLTRDIPSGRAFSSDVEALFERMTAESTGEPAEPIDLREYLRTI